MAHYNSTMICFKQSWLGGGANLIEEVKTLPQATQFPRTHFKFDICHHILSAVLFTNEDVKIGDKVCLKLVKCF